MAVIDPGDGAHDPGPAGHQADPDPPQQRHHDGEHHDDHHDQAPDGSGRTLMERFYLGCPEPAWLERTDVPLFVSDTRLSRRRLPVALGPWALDSGGFTMLQQHGRWLVDPAEYAARVRRYRDEVGGLVWAAAQDWMCEPAIIHGGESGPLRFVGTGLSVLEHQRRTVANLLELRRTAPDLPWVPVVQGYTLAEYLHCIELYADAGVDLRHEPLVALGSVCRRQATGEIRDIVGAVREQGLARLHGFGVKAGGLGAYGDLLASADSQAWSYRARRERIRMPGHRHLNCASCLPWALTWRAELLRDSSDATVTEPPAAPAGTTAARAEPILCDCGSAIAPRRTGRPALYCGPACRTRAYRQRKLEPVTGCPHG